MPVDSTSEVGAVGYGGTERENRHSRMGVASFVIGMVTTVVAIALFVLFGYLLSSVLQGVDPQSIDPQSLQDSPQAVGLGLAAIGIFACLILYFIGFVLGVAGIFQRRRKRLFAVLGAVGNGIVLFAFVALIVLGLVVGGVQGTS